MLRLFSLKIVMYRKKRRGACPFFGCICLFENIGVCVITVDKGCSISKFKDLSESFKLEGLQQTKVVIEKD